MKEGHRNYIEYIKSKEEKENSLLRKIRDMRDEIISLKEHRAPKEKRAGPCAKQESLGPGWSHIVRGGRDVKAPAKPKSPNKTTTRRN
jgi:hypothetical protein